MAQRQYNSLMEMMADFDVENYNRLNPTSDMSVDHMFVGYSSNPHHRENIPDNDSPTEEYASPYQAIIDQIESDSLDYDYVAELLKKTMRDGCFHYDAREEVLELMYHISTAEKLKLFVNILMRYADWEELDPMRTGHEEDFVECLDAAYRESDITNRHTPDEILNIIKECVRTHRETLPVRRGRGRGRRSRN